MTTQNVKHYLNLTCDYGVACCRWKLRACCRCDSKFTSFSGLLVHVLGHAEPTDERKYDYNEEASCPFCNVAYASHGRTETSTSKGFVCAHCDLYVSRKRVLQVHVQIAHNTPTITSRDSGAEPPEKWYACRVCRNVVYNKSATMREHMRVKHDLNVDPEEDGLVRSMTDVTYPCETCWTPCLLSKLCSVHTPDKSPDAKKSCPSRSDSMKWRKKFGSTTPSDCNAHVERHVCVLCDVKLPDCSSLWSHVYTEHKHAAVQCNLCEVPRMLPSTQPSAMVRHMQRVHKKPLHVHFFNKDLRQKCRTVVDGDVMFRCPHCAVLLKSFWSLKEHIHIHTGEKSHACPTCGKKFRFRTRLLSHLKSVHENVRSHVCNYCGHAFNDKSNLNVHIRLHTGEKKYVCELCGASFVQWAGLYYHKFTHGSKRFPCVYCERTYRSPNDLQKHLKTHTDTNMAYVCETCGKVFKTPRNMQRHVKIHIAVRAFTCDMCPASFKLKKYLTQHYRVHRKQEPASVELS